MRQRCSRKSTLSHSSWKKIFVGGIGILVSFMNRLQSSTMTATIQSPTSSSEQRCYVIIMFQFARREYSLWSIASYRAHDVTLRVYFRVLSTHDTWHTTIMHTLHILVKLKHPPHVFNFVIWEQYSSTFASILDNQMQHDRCINCGRPHPNRSASQLMYVL
jgi:hypothetical protein